MSRTFPAMVALFGTASLLLVDSAIKGFLMLRRLIARWVLLTMAGSLLLQGRLQAILSDRLSRRKVSTTIGTLALLIGGSIAIPMAQLRAAADENIAEPKGGAPLKPAAEQKLKWGEPVNGLRMALAWPPTLGEPGMGDAEEFFLVVQNVSETAVRLAAGDEAPNLRRLMMRENGRPLQAIGDPVPTPGDWLLQPREVVFLRLFLSNATVDDGRTVSSVIEQDIRTVPQYGLTAEMTIEKAPAGTWTGKLTTGETRGSADVIPPKHKDAQMLYKSWTTASRANGDIPGALIGLLAESVKLFIKNNPTWETTPQLEKILPSFDVTRDWAGQDAVALLDELAALQDTPIKMALDREEQGIIRAGAPLPPSLADAPWGKTLSNGLRHAWLLEPQAAKHRLGTPLTARVLIHNSGKEPVVFRTRTWHQLAHKATDAKGAEIKTESTSWTTRGLLLTYRLAPGEFIEVNGPGIGVGPKGDPEDWQQTRVGTWIEAKAGEDVTVTTAPLPLYDWNEDLQLKLDGEPRWWLDDITARLSRHLPFPADKNARERLLYRVAMELFGTPYNDAAFVADTTPGALDALATRMFHRPGQNAWAGPLESAPTNFRVLPAEPDAAKKPKDADARIKPESLLGFWRGTLDGEAISVSFHRPPADTDVQCDIYFGEATIGALMAFTIAPDGKSVTLKSRGKGGGEYGELTPGEGGTLQLELAATQPKPGKAVLTRDADVPSDVPR